MLKSSLHWLSSIVLGGFLVGAPKSLLDNTPLRGLLSRNVRFPVIENAIERGYLDAVTVTAAGYATARSTSISRHVTACTSGHGPGELVCAENCTSTT